MQIIVESLTLNHHESSDRQGSIMSALQVKKLSLREVNS